MSNPKPLLKSYIASVPLVPTFVSKLAATGYECQNRDTSGEGGDITAFPCLVD
jgi:hypothetical protein